MHGHGTRQSENRFRALPPPPGLSFNAQAFTPCSCVVIVQTSRPSLPATHRLGITACTTLRIHNVELYAVCVREARGTTYLNKLSKCRQATEIKWKNANTNHESSTVKENQSKQSLPRQLFKKKFIFKVRGALEKKKALWPNRIYLYTELERKQNTLYKKISSTRVTLTFSEFVRASLNSPNVCRASKAITCTRREYKKHASAQRKKTGNQMLVICICAGRYCRHTVWSSGMVTVVKQFYCTLCCGPQSVSLLAN